MRKTHRCTKCQHPAVLKIHHVPDVTGGLADDIDDGLEAGVRPRPSTPWRIARVPTGRPAGDEQRGAAGIVEAYICKQCGYTELYTWDPESIPIDDQYVTELSPPEGEGPFR